VYSSFFLRIQTIIKCAKYSDVYGEYIKFRVACDTQNRHRVRGKNLCVHGEVYSDVYGEYSKFRVACSTEIFSECAEKIYAYMEKTQKDTKLRLSK
jgi:hypothetical protein